MNMKWLAVMLLGATAMFAQISIGIRIGAPPPPQEFRVQPRSHGAGYVWLGGYWFPNGNKYKWHDGYWTRPPYEGAHWVEPNHDGERFHEGRWAGDKGDVNHNHKWDKGRDRNRDYNRQNDRR